MGRGGLAEGPRPGREAHGAGGRELVGLGDGVGAGRGNEHALERLAGLVAGKPQRCLPRYRRNDQEIVDRGTILYRDGRDRVFRNDPPGGCGSLDPTRTLVVTAFNDEYCRGDIIRVLDQSTGTIVGSCSFSDFVPYTRPGSRADRSGS